MKEKEEKEKTSDLSLAKGPVLQKEKQWGFNWCNLIKWADTFIIIKHYSIGVEIGIMAKWFTPCFPHKYFSLVRLGYTHSTTPYKNVNHHPPL